MGEKVLWHCPGNGVKLGKCKGMVNMVMHISKNTIIVCVETTEIYSSLWHLSECVCVCGQYKFAQVSEYKFRTYGNC